MIYLLQDLFEYKQISTVDQQKILYDSQIALSVIKLANICHGIINLQELILLQYQTEKLPVGLEQVIMGPSAEQYRSNCSALREEYNAVIRETKNMVKNMTEQQCFQKAKLHIIDALDNKDPRPMFYSQQLTTLYYFVYLIQSSLIWDWLIFLLSYTYMYLVILDNESFIEKISLQGSILLVFVLDTIIDFYCKSFDTLKRKNKYPNFYFWKAALLILMIIDLIIFITVPCYQSRPIRPFRILRAFIPAAFDPEVRRTLVAVSSAYKDIVVFILYYSAIIFAFVLIGTYTLTFDPNYVEPNTLYAFDEYKSNYNDLSKMVFQVYALATYDNYPDNQTLAVQNYQANTIYFFVFIFLNMFLFASIPGTIFYNKFRETRSKYVIIDQIKQQNSLILAFVTLAGDQTNLTFDTLIRFLFYFYKNKIQYVEYITHICLKLDDNNNQTIQVNQFMELSKILLYNSAMYPPTYDDLTAWIEFRKYMNDHFHIKRLVKHWLFNLAIGIGIVLAAINCIFYVFLKSPLSQTFDKMFIWIYFAQILLKMIGIGPYKLFSDRWNIVYTAMNIVSAVCMFVDPAAKAFNLTKMFRFFRLFGSFRMFLQSEHAKILRQTILNDIKRVFMTFMQIMHIIVKYFHLFAFIFFVFGILGMEIFYQAENKVGQNTSYNIFDQFSNFKTFIHSQYIMMQILTEGSWSTVAMSYSWREQDYYGYIIAFFIFMHIMIVMVIGNLLKGIFWQCYFTVNSMIDEIQSREQALQQKDEFNELKAKQIEQINQLIDKNESFEPDTIIKREIIEKKLDFSILKRIKNNFQFYNEERPAEQMERGNSRSKIVSKILEDLNITPKQLDIPKKKPSVTMGHYKKKKTLNLSSIKQKEEIDFQQEMQELLNRLIVSSKIKYSEIIAYPKIFVNFLNSKFKKPELYIDERHFDLNVNPLFNQQSINYHLYSMNDMLGIESSTREKKNIIVNCLQTNKLIDETTADEIIKTKHSIKKFHIDNDGAIRKMFLSQTNQDLIKKVEIQYFSDVYGQSFKQINKITLQPLLRYEATLTSSLWNILRYQQIDVNDFFHLLTHIQDQMSNKLIKSGSLVKFVYKLDHQSDIWFAVELKTYQDMQIRFIKTGLWTFTPNLQENTTYYGKDVFNWKLEDCAQSKVCEQYIKLFYQSFQTLAFSLSDKKPFFQSNPKQYIYDLYIHNYNVTKKNRKSSFGHLKISNIMLVILCKEDQRIDIGGKNLPYEVSDIHSERRKRKQEDFILDDQKETFEKLKNLGASDHQKIIESEGLPFAYIINLMKQISDMLKLYHEHFVNQVEKALNQSYNSLNQNQKSKEDFQSSRERIIEIPQTEVYLQDLDQV